MSLLMSWVEGKPVRAIEADPHAPIGVADEPASDLGGGGSRPSHLSSEGQARWACLQALTHFKNTQPSGRWAIVASWAKSLPMASLDVDDRHRFIAWIILGLDDIETHQIAQLAAWLEKSGMKDIDRLSRWAEEIEGWVEVPGTVKLRRAGMNKDLRIELARKIREVKESKGLKPSSRRD